MGIPTQKRMNSTNVRWESPMGVGRRAVCWEHRKEEEQANYVQFHETAGFHFFSIFLDSDVLPEPENQSIQN